MPRSTCPLGSIIVHTQLATRLMLFPLCLQHRCKIFHNKIFSSVQYRTEIILVNSAHTLQIPNSHVAFVCDSAVEEKMCFSSECRVQTDLMYLRNGDGDNGDGGISDGGISDSDTCESLSSIGSPHIAVVVT